MDTKIKFNMESCSACGLCAEVCPNQIIKKDIEIGMTFRPDRLFLCFACGQCMAICPSRAIVVEGLTYERDFFTLCSTPVGEMSFLELIKTRRAVRVFQEKPVPKEVLEKIVQAITFAPPGFPPIKTEVVVVQDTRVIRQALPEMIKVYDGLIRAVSHPIGRFFVRYKVGKEKFKTLMQHVVPMMKNRLPELKKGTEDAITRHAPAIIIFHANCHAENYEEDMHIALTYGFLAVHALGLGGSAMSLIPPAIQNSPVLRKLFLIPDSNVVVGAMIIGYPMYRYQRGIKRALKGVSWI